MKKAVAIWCAFLLVMWAGSVMAQGRQKEGIETATLKISMSGFNNEKGSARIALCNSKEYTKRRTGGSGPLLPRSKVEKRKGHSQIFPSGAMQSRPITTKMTMAGSIRTFSERQRNSTDFQTMPGRLSGRPHSKRRDLPSTWQA